MKSSKRKKKFLLFLASSLSLSLIFTTVIACSKEQTKSNKTTNVAKVEIDIQNLENWFDKTKSLIAINNSDLSKLSPSEITNEKLIKNQIKALDENNLEFDIPKEWNALFDLDSNKQANDQEGTLRVKLKFSSGSKTKYEYKVLRGLKKSKDIKDTRDQNKTPDMTKDVQSDLKKLIESIDHVELDQNSILKNKKVEEVNQINEQSGIKVKTVDGKDFIVPQGVSLSFELANPRKDNSEQGILTIVVVLSQNGKESQSKDFSLSGLAKKEVQSNQTNDDKANNIDNKDLSKDQMPMQPKESDKGKNDKTNEKNINNDNDINSLKTSNKQKNSR
ncbi:LIPOPROTEIN D [Mycoplasmopsis pulmonis]|uniref:LIPOPROTEIN D n=1 Tax=Mycoplasmopsis pulmonis (strain UAB CTIP) TaxID=272635 RepID=Q98Q48_MYCPU|nr:lipoprotein 17-related variable surface protein [Mycoplasmopsis pulmonis]CAC13693.1 LIPOPROTEIN D [Mycoplasmopsis pulmonis]